MTLLLAALAVAVASVIGGRAAIRSRRRQRWRRLLLAPPRLPVRATAGARFRAVGRRPLATARLALVTGTVAGGVLGLVAGGPISAVVLAAYGGTGLLALHRSQLGRAEARSRRAAGDAVAALAAELRAGLAVGPIAAAAEAALTGPSVVGSDATRIARRVTAAIAVADSSGAPLADVLDRLDHHLRGADRARASATAQASGARVSALILSVLPIAGVAVGFAIGVDPVALLLGSRLGAACLLGAVTLQLAGLAWSARLSRIEVPT